MSAERKAIRFIHKAGHVVPITVAAGGAGKAARAGHSALKAARVGAAAIGAHAAIKGKGDKIKVNPLMNIAGLGLSVASGAIAAATFGTPRGLAVGHTIAKAIDVAGVSTNAASVVGRGHAKARALQGAKQEARNFVVGNGVFVAGVLGSAKNRQALLSYSKKVVEFGRKVLKRV